LFSLLPNQDAAPQCIAKIHENGESSKKTSITPMPKRDGSATRRTRPQR
jgi:hypothetical protein